MKNLAKIFLSLLFITTFVSCGSDDDSPPPINVVLTSINPTYGTKDLEVTITGVGFGSNTSDVSVFFNSKEAVVLSVDDTTILTKVPEKAYTGNIKIIIRDTEINGQEFTYLFSDIETSLVAGSGVAGNAEGNGVSANFNTPIGIAVDSHGNTFVADYSNHTIRKIDINNNTITFAGNGSSGNSDGTGINARFSHPWGIAIDANDNLFVADYGNHRIRKITPSAVVTTIAGSVAGYEDGNGANSKFKYPAGIAIDSNGNLFVADVSNNRIRKIDTSGNVTTFAGAGDPGNSDGDVATATFKRPFGVVIDSHGDFFIMDTDNRRIRKISGGTVSTFVGSDTGDVDGIGINAKVSVCYSISIDSHDNIFIPDNGNDKIKHVTPTGMVSTLAGLTSGYLEGTADVAEFNKPYGVAVDTDNNLIITDTYNHRIRKMTMN